MQQTPRGERATRYMQERVQRLQELYGMGFEDFDPNVQGLRSQIEHWRRIREGELAEYDRLQEAKLNPNWGSF